jgi:diadenosine tetraphosphate (Ap4A) HIT family hydrolase
MIDWVCMIWFDQGRYKQMNDASEDCPFCMIARGEGSSVEVVCERDQWVAFFPPEPATPGHTLVIPRVHVADLWSADARLSTELMEAVIHVGHAVEKAVNPEGMNLITSRGEAAEQSVFHLHLHIVPRWRDDELDLWPPKQPMQKELKDNVADAVRKACLEQ